MCVCGGGGYITVRISKLFRLIRNPKVPAAKVINVIKSDNLTLHHIRTIHLIQHNIRTILLIGPIGLGVESYSKKVGR